MAAQTPRILIFDDHPDTRDLYVQFLTESGFTVFATGTAEEVAAMTAKEAIDVVALDLSGGLPLIRDLAALPRPPRLIAVTGRQPSGAPEESFLAAYCVKPCLPDELQQAIEEVLARR